MITNKRLNGICFEVGLLLDEYIKVHDYLLGTSVRRILPIPSIFKPIDFQKSKDKLLLIIQRLDFNKEQVESIPSETLTGSEREAKKILIEYVDKLSSAIMQLVDVCTLLLSQAAGISVSFKNYKEEMAKYDKLVHDYAEAGTKLNSFMK